MSGVTHPVYNEVRWIPFPMMYQIKYSDAFTGPVWKNCTTAIVDDTIPDSDFLTYRINQVRKTLFGH